MAIASYPHVEMHVRDDSIYTPSTSEILPLNKPLYMMKTARGPVGVPVWCATYTDAVRVFGADTFNKRSEYYSENAYFLTKTFPFNGAFIMRVAGENAVNAHISLEIGLSNSTENMVPQWKRDTNGNFELELDGSKIAINAKGQTYDEWKADPGEATSFVQATLPGYKVAWRAHLRPNTGDPRELGTDQTATSDNFKWYPMIDIEASNPGAWGKAYGIKMYFDTASNTLATTVTNGAVTYSIAPIEILQDATVPTSIVDAYGSTVVTGVIKPDVVDAETDLDLSMDKRLKKAYSGKQELPLSFTYIAENWQIVGRELMLKELAAREAAHVLYPDLPTVVLEENEVEGEIIQVLGVKSFIDELFNKVVKATDDEMKAVNKPGYMANVVSLGSYIGVPYFASCVIDANDALLKSDTKVIITESIVPTSDTPILLDGGTDGGEDGIPHDWEVEEYMRAHIRRAVSFSHTYLNDYWRCPFNVVYDTGVSIKTKKAIIDFTAVRDDVVAVIGTHVAWRGGDAKKGAAGYDDLGDPIEWSQMDDESLGASLRAYALLMKEDTENGVGACRTKIFCHAGKTSDHDDKWVSYTLWLALKNAEYLNKDFIDKEPKELPYSSVDCFTQTSWTAAQEDTKSRVWNAGLNYVQYYDMNNVHFAAVRSVYSYETSILVDAGVVDALTFMKNITRRSWSTWAGSTRKAEALNQAITADLNSRLSYMLHGKFEHSVNVYQTTEDTNLGYARHVDLELIAPGQNRAWKATIICKREGFNPEA